MKHGDYCNKWKIGIHLSYLQGKKEAKYKHKTRGKKRKKEVRVKIKSSIVQHTKTRSKILLEDNIFYVGF